MKQKKSLIVFTSLLALGWGLKAQSDYPFQQAEMTNVTVSSGFWLPRIETNRIVTVTSDFKRNEETGRIHNFEAAGRREGKGFRGIAYDDSDVFKIIEGASYTLATCRDAELEKYLDNLISHIQAHDSVEQNRGRLAVERGPVVYCAEGVDNGGKVLDKAIRPNAKFKRTTCNILGNQYPAFCVETTAKSELKLVPYFSWCHRDVGEMQTWFPVE